MIAGVLIGLLFFFMLLGFPMLVGMIASPIIVVFMFYDSIDMGMLTQQMAKGVSGYVLLCVPMFMLAADIMCQGEMSKRLLDFVGSLVGHVPGGLAVTTGATCTIFGAISGSTQATLVAVGKPMFRPMIKAGYDTSHTIALLMSNANIALLIPPSVCMIMYCVSTGTSVAELFLAGIWPGLFMFLCFAVYDIVYAKRRHIISMEKASWKTRIVSFRKAILPLGFPVLVLGGIYSGIFSPTEAAAASVLYAMILECFVYRTLGFKDLYRVGKNTAIISAAVYILIAGGALFSWLISYARLPQQLAELVLGFVSTPTGVLLFVTVFFFIACMFVDSIPVIIIMSPIIYPIAMAVGCDPMHLGIIITLQSAIGCITPPFGANIFTACGIFQKDFGVVVRGLIPYMILNLIVSIVLVVSPTFCLLSRNLFM